MPSLSSAPLSSPMAGALPPSPIPGKPVLMAVSDSNAIGDGITNHRELRLEGQAAPNTWVTISLGPEPGGQLIARALTDANGHWSNLCEQLDFGSYSIVVTQTVEGSSTSSASEALQVIIQNEPDQLRPLELTKESDTGQDGRDGITMESKPTVTGFSEALAEIKLYLNGGTEPIATVTADDKGSWSYQFKDALKDGSYHVTATQTMHGFTSIQSEDFTFKIDNHKPDAPTIRNIRDSDDSGVKGDHITSEVKPRLEGSGKDGYVHIYDSASGNEIGGSEVGDNGSWRIRLDKLSKGEHTVYAREESITGVLSDPSANFVLTIEPLAAPTGLALDASTDSGVVGDGITTASELVLKGRGQPGTEIYIGLSDAGKPLNSSIVDEHGNWSVKLPPLPPGDYTFVGIVADNIDNESPFSEPLKVTILPTPFKLAENSDSGVKGDGITANNRPTFEGMGHAGNDIELRQGEGGPLLGKVTVNDKGQWRLAIDKLGDGKHKLVAYEIKGSDQVSKQEMTLTIDTTAPGKPKLSNSIVESTMPKNSEVGKLSADDAGSAQLTYKVVSQTENFYIDGDKLVIRDPKAVSTELQVVSVEVSDAAGNSTVEQLSVRVKHVAPPKPEPEPEPIPLVDGVNVSSGTSSLPDGRIGKTVFVPLVDSERIDSGGARSTADIPLVDQGNAKLTAHLPAGLGLRAIGADSQAAGTSLEHLLSVIKTAAAQHTASDLGYLTSKGVQYLSQVAPETGLQVERLELSSNGNQPAGPLTLSGTAQAQQHTALVIDTQALPTGAAIVLQDVSFASVIGSARISASTAGQILSGDQASQHFSVHSGAGGKVFAGGGNDMLQFGTAGQAGTQSAAPVNPAPVATLLDGGQGQDAASFLGKQADYQITRHDGYVTVASLAKPNEVATIVNVEKLQFSDSVLNLEARTELTSLAALYQNVLGRQADAQGFSFWGKAQSAGVSMGKIALEIISSAEGGKQGFAFHGDAKQDLTTLYQAIFERAPDADGFAFWLQALQNGVSLEQVADGFLQSVEMVGFNKAQGNWDFSF
ncbi:Ig-like domain-containing protein [Massilia sp. BJB1822]|uniref:Ig-like domain-containing protein n=1 Tax=Massilia sp. BJB1822 TaxID=2744470 RepID=UPI001593E98D|nr:Ig-like domain-containing protein [Massilia sp. BJB1822]NVD96433.1 DUF4214 domain-containing protein [Massilia sp. BJB1822]